MGTAYSLKSRQLVASCPHVLQLAGDNDGPMNPSSYDDGGSVMAQTRQLPQMPPIGKPESYYAKQCHAADRYGDPHAHEAHKVGQYVTLALAPGLDWQTRCKYFDHAIRRHCTPPPLPDEDVWMFYQSLADLVRMHAGQLALEAATKQDDRYAARLAAGEPKSLIAHDAELFFARLLGASKEKPEHFSEEDWQQLKLIRDQWV